MPRINLLPIKAARRQVSARNEMFAMLILVMAVIAGLFTWYNSVDSELETMRNEIQNIEAEIVDLGEEVKKVEDLQAKEKKVKKKLGIIKKLVANRTGPARMLSEIAVILTTEAKRVWLTKLAGKDDGTLILAGGAMDHEDISEFQLALERRDAFTKVQLKNVKTASTDDVRHLTWEISCVMRFRSGS